MATSKAVKLQAEEHEIVKVENFQTVEEFVLYLMHQSDYESAQKLVVGKDVLDLGCNCGYGTNCLSRMCKRIVGVDVSPSAIDEAKSRYKGDKASFQVVDGTTLPFADNSFDIITSFQVIEHLDDYNSYFKEARRVLRVDGILLLTTPNAAIRVRPGERPWNPFHMHEFRGEELNGFLQQYFSFVKVFGGFAMECPYNIELNRCLRNRDRVKTEINKPLRSLVIDSLPSPLLKFLRAIRQSIYVNKKRQISESLKNKFTTDDFYYKSSDLDTSLNLIGVCSDSKESISDANGTLIIKNE